MVKKPWILLPLKPKLVGFQEWERRKRRLLALIAEVPEGTVVNLHWLTARYGERHTKVHASTMRTWLERAAMQEVREKVSFHRGRTKAPA